MRNSKRGIAALLVLTMLCTMLPGVSLRTSAAELDTQTEPVLTEAADVTEAAQIEPTETFPEMTAGEETVPEETVPLTIVSAETIPAETAIAEETSQTLAAEEALPEYTEIHAEETVTVAINTAGEYVYFAFQPQYSESYTFSPSSGYTYLCLYDSDMIRLIRTNSYALTYTMEAGQTYILCAGYPSSEVTGSYDLTLKTNHNDSNAVITENTCTEDGSKVYTCPNCGKQITEVIPASHVIVDGVCTRCGKWICGEDLTWRFDEETATLTISGTGEMSFRNQPWEKLADQIQKVEILDGVTSISSHAFGDCVNMKAISIPKSVTDIGSVAFANCCSLTNVEIPENVTSISDGAFWECSSLTSVTLPKGLTSIERSAFWECRNLGAISIPSGVTAIGESAFSGCDSLTSVVIPAGVTTIHNFTFAYCESLTSVSLPNTVQEICWQAFGYCKKLTEITIPNSVTTLGSAFIGCSALEHIVIPESVTSLAYYSFKDCSSLEDIELPESLERIEWNVFENCYSLKEMDLPDNVKTVYPYLFKNCSHLTTVDLPANLESIDLSAFVDCDNLTSITIPGTVTNIYDTTTYEYGDECTSLTEILVDDSNETYCSVDGVVFDKDFTEVIRCPHGKSGGYNIPSGIQKIGPDAFWNCKNLTDITIPDGITTISSGAFYGCEDLTSITIPSSVSGIGGNAFLKCSELAEIQVANDNQNYCSIDGVLYNKDVTKLIRFPEGKSGACQIPESVTDIEAELGSYAFSGCSEMTSIDLPKNLTTLYYKVFYDCTSLSSIRFHGDAPDCDSGAFYGVTATAYYPMNNTTWTYDVRQNCGGDITWLPYNPDNPGDIDGDGNINVTDASYLLWDVLFPDEQSGAVGQDFNNDQKADINDVVYLLWAILFPDLFPL